MDQISFCGDDVEGVDAAVEVVAVVVVEHEVVENESESGWDDFDQASAQIYSLLYLEWTLTTMMVWTVEPLLKLLHFKCLYCK